MLRAGYFSLPRTAFLPADSRLTVHSSYTVMTKHEYWVCIVILLLLRYRIDCGKMGKIELWFFVAIHQLALNCQIINHKHNIMDVVKLFG